MDNTAGSPSAPGSGARQLPVQVPASSANQPMLMGTAGARIETLRSQCLKDVKDLRKCGR